MVLISKKFSKKKNFFNEVLTCLLCPLAYDESTLVNESHYPHTVFNCLHGSIDCDFDILVFSWKCVMCNYIDYKIEK